MENKAEEGSTVDPESTSVNVIKEKIRLENENVVRLPCATFKFLCTNSSTHLEMRVTDALHCMCAPIAQGDNASRQCECPLTLHAVQCQHVQTCYSCQGDNTLTQLIQNIPTKPGDVRVKSEDRLRGSITLLVKHDRCRDVLQELRAHAGLGGGSGTCLHVYPVPPSVLTTMSRMRSFQKKESIQQRVAQRKERLARGRAFAPKLFATLHEFQRQGVKHALEGMYCGRWLCADEMGLGKTLQALAMCVCFHDEWPMLVVCPASLRLTLYADLLRWVAGVLPQDIQVVSSGKRFDATQLKSKPVTITSYTMLHKRREHFEGAGFKVVYMDESHRMRTTQSRKNGEAYNHATDRNVMLLRKARRVVLCSGTPLLTKPSELWDPVFALLHPLNFPSSSSPSSSSSSSSSAQGFPGAMHDFRRRYCDAHEVTRVTDNPHYRPTSDMKGSSSSSFSSSSASTPPLLSSAGKGGVDNGGKSKTLGPPEPRRVDRYGERYSRVMPRDTKSKHIVTTRWSYNGVSNHEELFFFMKSLLLTRRSKKDVLT
jgi:hypothetical protein